MKKFFFLAFALLTAVVSAWATAPTSGTFPDGGKWNYDSKTKVLSINAVQVPDYDYTATKDYTTLGIPESLVSNYGKAGSYQIRLTMAPWGAYASEITKITIDPKIQIIGENAFSGMWNVKSVEIDYASAQNIATLEVRQWAFAQCLSLEEFDFSRVAYLRTGAFEFTALSYVEFSNDIQRLGSNVFYRCYKLMRPIYDASGNKQLNREPSIYYSGHSLPKNHESIGADAFAKAEYDEKYEIVVMYNYSMYGKTNAPAAGHTWHREVVYGAFPEDGGEYNWVIYEGMHPFWYVNGDNQLIIDCDMMPRFPLSGADWKDFKSSVKEVHLFSEAFSINNNAFPNFTKLETVAIHNDEKHYSLYIGSNAFKNCSSLKTINLEDIYDVCDSAFLNCSSLKTVNLSNCVYVRNRAFQGCSLRTIHFTDRLSKIFANAFYSGIKDGAVIYMKKSTPPELESDAFAGINQSAITLNIAEEDGNAYNVTPWSNFKRTAVGTALYGVFNGSNMNIYYDEKMGTRGGTQDWTTSSYSSQRAAVTKVIFDNSVLQAAPTSMNKWFNGFSNLEQIVNIDYLNTGNVTDMEALFKGCKKLKSIDLSGFNTANVYNMESMFEDCDALTTLDVNSFTMTKVRFITKIFYSCDNLERIYSDKSWSYLSSQMAIPDNLFTGSTKLVGGRGHKYRDNCTSMEYACTDGIHYIGYFWRSNDDGVEWHGITVYYYLEGTPWADGTDLWNANTLNEYCTMTTSVPGIINRTTDHKHGTKIQFSDFTSDFFFMEGRWKGAGEDNGYTNCQEFTLTVDDDMHVVIYLWARNLYSKATQSTGNYGTVTTNNVYAPITLLDDTDKYPEDTWRMTYTASEKSNGHFVGWIPDKWVELYGSEEDAISVAKYLKGVAESTGYTDVDEYKLLKKFEQKEFSIKPSEFEYFANYCGVTMITDDGITSNLVMRAVFDEVEPDEFKVFTDSPNGYIYDRNGETKLTYMGDSCFYVYDGSSLNLDVVADDGYVFDHWTVDGVDAGSTLPLELTPTQDNTVVKAVFKKKPVSPSELAETMEVGYVCDFTTKVSKHSAYNDSWTYDSNWTVYGGANNNGGWEYVKMGGKNTTLANANPVYVVNKTAFSKEIKAVIVTYPSGSFSKGGMGCNEWGVKVYSDLECKKLLYTVKGDGLDRNGQAIVVLPDDGQTWAAGYAVQVYWDLENSGSTNGVIWIDKIEYLIEKSGSTGLEEGETNRVQAAKVIIDGVMYIIRDGRMYNTQGAEVR